jgi:hypothetical protein
MLFTNVCENIAGLYVEVKVKAFFGWYIHTVLCFTSMTDIGDMLG